MNRLAQIGIIIVAVLLAVLSAPAQNPPAAPVQPNESAARGAQGPPPGGRGGRGGRGGGPTGPMLQISTDPGPAAEMVKSALDAFNRRDLDYFRKALAEDAVWLDDDGHIFASRNQIVNIPLMAELTEATKRKLTPSNMRSGMSGDTAWATFYYELDTDGTLRHGLSTMVFRKIGDNWQIAVVQAASNMMQQHLPGDHTDQ
jgi:ketosteroid isomerase-like protein